MSTTTLRSRRRSPHPDPGPVDTGPNGRAIRRFPPQVASDLQDCSPLRSSQTSGQTSYSSYDPTSGTERSSVLTKSSSLTDLSPDTPDGFDGQDDEISVDDVLGMYFDDPEDGATVHAGRAGSDLAVIAEVLPPPSEKASPPSEWPLYDGRGEHQVTDQKESDITAMTSTAVEEPSQSREDQDTATPQSDGQPREELFSDTSPDDIEPIEPLDFPAPPTKIPLTEANDQPPPSPRQSTIVRIAGNVPPAFLDGNGGRDRYGFHKATPHVSLPQFESWNGPYAASAENRRKKWVELLETSGLPTQSPVTFPPKSSKMKRYIRKGIPSEYRGAAWFYYAGGFDHMHRHPGRYADLVRQAMSSPSNDDKEHIERDLYRTFPDNVHFKPEVPEGPDGNTAQAYSSVIVETQMIRSLRRVLYAFSLHNPRIGYTQSLNFITGLFLLFLPEEQAFWMLHIVTSEFLPGTHDISLEGANVDLWILMVLLKENLPSIYTKIANSGPTSAKARPPALTVQTRLPDITLGLTNWLMSLFIGSLPLETTLRVWDCFFYEGSKTFFRVSLAIFKASEREIMAVSDPMEVFQIVQTVPKKLLDANSLMDESLARRHRVGQGRIDSLRNERRTAIRQEKTRLSLVTGKALGLGSPERPATRTGARSPLPRFDMGSWRRLKMK
jgi:hypothetical protein